ncbi:hypothetical protein QUW41_09705 [Slackia piriformis]|nr:hypothetical protein [Slackia piriformis]
MIPSSFTQGVWGKSWEEARGDNAVQGTANLGDEGVVLDIPCGKLLGSPGVVINGEKELSATEHLYGFSQDGYALVLGNAAYSGGETHYPGMVHQVIRADYLMAAKGCREFNPLSMINRMDIEIRNLTDWYGISAYRMAFERDDRGNARFKSLEYRKEDDEPSVLLESEQCSITLFDKYVIPGLNVNEMTFRHQCCLKVCFSAGKTLEEARDFATNLSKFFSLCMGFHASIQRLFLYVEGDESAIQYYAPLLDSPAPSKAAIREMPFPCRVLRGEIGDYLRNWFNYGAEKKDEEDYLLFKRAGDLIVSILTYDWKMPVELQCVSVSQALEAISRYKANLASWPRSELRQNRKELLKRIEGMPEEFVTWVWSRIEQSSKGAKRLMVDLMDRQKDAVEWLVPDIGKFVSEQQNARNTYSHGSVAATVDPSYLYRLTMGPHWLAMSYYGDCLACAPHKSSASLSVLVLNHG